MRISFRVGGREATRRGRYSPYTREMPPKRGEQKRGRKLFEEESRRRSSFKEGRDGGLVGERAVRPNTGKSGTT